MQTVKEIQNAIAAMQEQLKIARQKEMSGALEQIQRLIQEYGIQAEDIFPNFKLKQTPSKREVKMVEPQYMDPATGKTWSGRGITPTWIRDQDKEKFRITKPVQPEVQS